MQEKTNYGFPKHISPNSFLLKAFRDGFKCHQKQSEDYFAEEAYVLVFFLGKGTSSFPSQ